MIVSSWREMKISCLLSYPSTEESLQYFPKIGQTALSAGLKAFTSDLADRGGLFLLLVTSCARVVCTIQVSVCVGVDSEAIYSTQ